MTSKEIDFCSSLLHTDVSLYLTSGVKLGGVITELHPSGLLLTRDGVDQAVFWHAVATILPKPIYD